MLKLAHTADWHWEAEKLERCQASAEYIIAKLQEIKPDLHVIAGDYWNRRQMLTSSSAFRPAIDCLTRIASICPIVIIKGNNEHDAEGSIEWLSDLETIYPIFATERAGSIVWCGDSKFYPIQPGYQFPPDDSLAVLHLFPFPTKQHLLADKPGLSIDESNQLIQSAIRQIMHGFGAISADAKCPVILVGHCNVSGALLSTGQTLLGQDIMISKHDLELARADYVALGHIHKAQEIAHNVWYAGSMYHTNFGEVEQKQFNLVEIEHNGGHAVIEHITIPSRPLSLHECTFSNPGGWRDERRAERDWEGADLRVRISMTKEAAGLVDDKSVCDLYPGAATYQIERIIIPVERVRAGDIMKAQTLREKLLEWAKSAEKEIRPDVLELADETERSCRA